MNDVTHEEGTEGCIKIVTVYNTTSGRGEDGTYSENCSYIVFATFSLFDFL